MADMARPRDSSSALSASALAEVVAAAPTPLWVIGGEGGVALANHAALDVLRFRRDDVIGAHSHDVLHGSRPDGSAYPRCECPILTSGTHRRPHGTEWFIAADGEPIPVTWSTRKLPDGATTLLSFTRAPLAQHRGERERRRLEELTDAASPQGREQLIERLFDIMHERFTDPEFGAAALAGEAHLSLRTTQVLLAEVGTSPAASIRRLRLELAGRLLARGASVGGACAASGFGDAGSFARRFRAHFGVAPSAYRSSAALTAAGEAPRA